MINRILPLLNKAIPAALAIKGLGKIDPRLEKFFSSSVASGYSIDAALDFLREKFENPNQRNEKQRLDQDQNLRPDEAASRQTINESQRLPNALQNVASLGGGIGAGVASLLGSSDESEQNPNPDENIPKNQTALGPQTQAQNVSGRISQIAKNVKEAPGISKVYQSQNATSDIAKNAAQNAEDARSKMYKNSSNSSQYPNSPTDAAQFFIDQEPELGKYLDAEIKKGKTPEQAAISAKQNEKYSRYISRIERDVGQDFVDLIRQIFSGSSQQVVKKSPPKQSNEALIGLLDTLKQFQANLKAGKGG